MIKKLGLICLLFVTCYAAQWDSYNACWQVQFQDIQNAARRAIVVSTLFCAPFNSIPTALSGSLPGSLLGPGWTILIDPCSRRNLTISITACDPAFNSGFSTCMTSFINSNPTSCSVIEEYSYLPTPFSLSGITVTSLSSTLPALIRPNTNAIPTSNLQGSACTPLWFTGTNVTITNIAVNLDQCRAVDYLQAADRVCVRFSGNDVSNCYVQVSCDYAGVSAIVVQPTLAYSDGNLQTIKADNCTFDTTVTENNDGFDLMLWAVSSPNGDLNKAIKIRIDSFLVYGQIRENDLILIDDYEPNNNISVNMSTLGISLSYDSQPTGNTINSNTGDALNIVAAVFGSLVGVVILIGLGICIEHCCKKVHPDDFIPEEPPVDEDTDKKFV